MNDVIAMALPANTENPVPVGCLSVEELLREADRSDHPLVRMMAEYLAVEDSHDQALQAAGYDTVAELAEARDTAVSDAEHWEREHDRVERELADYQRKVARIADTIRAELAHILTADDVPEPVQVQVRTSMDDLSEL